MAGAAEPGCGDPRQQDGTEDRKAELFKNTKERIRFLREDLEANLKIN